MVMYENYQQLRSWIKKVDKGLIQSMAKGQAKKPRKGNKFMVVGANGYIGWALVCQLAYKFADCEIIIVDKNIDERKSLIKHYPLYTRVKKLSEYFSFKNSIVVVDMTDPDLCKGTLEYFKPDFIINLADGNKKYNPVLKNLLDFNKDAHLIISTNYKSKRRIEKDYKITDFKTANVVGACNWITLIDPVLSTYNDPNTLVNRLISEVVFSKKVVVDDVYTLMLSLEDFTRAVVKIIRKGQKNKYERYFACDKFISSEKLSTIIKSTLKYMGYDCKVAIRKTNNGVPKIKEKKRFVKLIDKHRPPVEYMISYSCKNFLDMR